ncbi:TPA: HEPN domain-containing protein [Candidatus Poribacteria bacterium]|nr:HEPN domain-containing protein [Candidatus Poribacteria bacterium]
MMLTWQQWMNKSQASMTAARNSLMAEDLAAAVSRAYFAAFQAVTGILIKRGDKPNPATGNWGHTGTQNQFTVLIRQIRSKQRRLRQARQHFRNLYLARPYADYGDDSIFTTNTVEQLVRQAGQVVSLMQRLIEDGDI